MTDRGSGGWCVPFLVLGSISALAAPAHAAVRMPTHVACVGDSITAGSGSTDAATKSYPAQLQQLFGSQVSVKNFGYSGATMLSSGYGDLPYENQTVYQSATSFVQGAGANAVVDVVIMLGTNDSKPQNWTPTGKPKNDQQFLTDYRAMVEHFTALTPKPEVFLALPLSTGTSPCCSISGTVIHNEILPLIEQLAKEKSLPVIDLNTPTANHPEYFTDGVHPNDAAYMIVAKIFHDGLLQDLAALSSGGSGGAGGSAGSGGAGGAGGSGAGGSSTGGKGGSGGSAGSGTAANGGVGGDAAGTGGVAAAAGSAGSVAASGAANLGATGASGSPASSGGSRASSGGSAALPNSNGSGSSGCSVSSPGGRGAFAALFSLSVLLALVGLRRRSVLHAEHDHDLGRSS